MLVVVPVLVRDTDMCGVDVVSAYTMRIGVLCMLDIRI